MKDHTLTSWWMEWEDNPFDLAVVLQSCAQHDSMTEKWFEHMAGFMRTLCVHRQNLVLGFSVDSLLVTLKLVDSITEARRKLKEGGVKINGARAQLSASLTLEQLLHDKWALFGLGKSSRALLMAVDIFPEEMVVV